MGWTTHEELALDLLPGIFIAARSELQNRHFVAAALMVSAHTGHAFVSSFTGRSFACSWADACFACIVEPSFSSLGLEP
jgi:hypothetical protein